MKSGTGLKSLSSFAVASLAIGFIALICASPGSAALPKTKTNLIVPGKSIAGLRLGTSMKQAKKIWKDTDGPQVCPVIVYFDPPGEFETCYFELASSGANYNTGNVYFIGKPSKTTLSIGVRAPLDGGTNLPVFKSKMNRYKTKEGVGIGTNLGKLKRIYKKKLKKESKVKKYSVYAVKGPGKSITEFSLYAGRVNQIEIRSPKGP
ncbi:MAG: hypothetical protein ACSLFI_05425 [Solirubrobacterales bacterium]